MRQTQSLYFTQTVCRNIYVLITAESELVIISLKHKQNVIYSVAETTGKSKIQPII